MTNVRCQRCHSPNIPYGNYDYIDAPPSFPPWTPGLLPQCVGITFKVDNGPLAWHDRRVILTEARGKFSAWPLFQGADADWACEILNYSQARPVLAKEAGVS